MPNLIDFYKGIFLQVIPVRMTGIRKERPQCVNSYSKSAIEFFQGCCSSVFVIVLNNSWLLRNVKYLIKVKNKNARKRFEIFSKLTIKTLERCH